VTPPILPRHQPGWQQPEQPGRLSELGTQIRWSRCPWRLRQVISRTLVLGRSLVEKIGTVWLFLSTNKFLRLKNEDRVRNLRSVAAKLVLLLPCWGGNSWYESCGKSSRRAMTQKLFNLQKAQWCSWGLRLGSETPKREGCEWTVMTSGEHRGTTGRTCFL
jgi:hypothetical protein